MTMLPEKTPEKIQLLLETELQLIWSAHQAVGLDGYMCLYTNTEQVPWRAKQAGITFWFSKEQTTDAIAEIIKHYNDGQLPNSPLLLNPVVHEKKSDDTYEPLGSGIAWCMAMCLGIDSLNDESTNRLWELGALASNFHRGESDRAGIKIITICDSVQSLTQDRKTVTGCKELYDLANIKCDQYHDSYMLSGISYLTNNGLFLHPDIKLLFPNQALATEASRQEIIRVSSVRIDNIIDAAFCWNSYERYHSLYKKFGTNTDDVETNLKFFNLVARDVQLFDATGPMRKGADAMFEFIVPGLIPRGAVTLLAASGGTGKSSLAHQLCVLASIDYEPGEEAPKWLGQRLAIEKCKGVCIYFSGEDGPPIINARANIFDPEGRAKRLMFQRNDFGEGATFVQHINKLHKIPNVSIVVIDPARKFLVGDEDDSSAVSNFFEAIEEFAIEKNAAVVVVHHLQKSAQPKHAIDIIDMLRGSQVFVDRPRVVIGMFRDGAYNIVGLAKNNIPPNMGMVTEERVFARDPQNLGLIWLPGHEGVRGGSLSQEELDILAQSAKQEGR
jgi:hypothetical protein